MNVASCPAFPSATTLVPVKTEASNTYVDLAYALANGIAATAATDFSKPAPNIKESSTVNGKDAVISEVLTINKLAPPFFKFNCFR